MRLSQLIGRRSKDVPREASSRSHQLLLRGAYIRPVATGIFSILPLGKRVLSRIEAIVREEMNAIDGQEVLMPIVMPRELWEESGRYQAIDSSMVRFKDRTQKDFVLGMTHEEAVLALARTEVSSYRQFPFMLYQIQSKFRDELRSRGGLIRVREFTMKDAYSFHSSEEDLKDYYARCYAAYERIFARVGLKNVRIVQSDTGMMGGSIAHEFMLETAIGEDSLVICRSCGYAANNEVASARVSPEKSQAQTEACYEVATPQTKSIADLCRLLKVDAKATAKAVFYSLESEAGQQLIFVLLRGDKDVNELKLAKFLRSDRFRMASDDEIRAIGCEPGFASPIGLAKTQDNLQILIDSSLQGAGSLTMGANKVDYHLAQVQIERDIKAGFAWADISFVNEGDPCSQCTGDLSLTRGIEIGNIFQLGSKYTKAMGMSYLDESGQSQIPTMGCYGIGIGRLMASILEEQSDERGPIWPQAVAPFLVHICMLDGNVPEVFARAEGLYQALRQMGIDVLWDDSQAQAGVQFADADLIGAPMRLTVSKRTEQRAMLEYRWRDGSDKGDLSVEGLVQQITNLLQQRS